MDSSSSSPERALPSVEFPPVRYRTWSIMGAPRARSNSSSSVVRSSSEEEESADEAMSEDESPQSKTTASDDNYLASGETSFISDGSESPLSSLGSRSTPTPPRSPSSQSTPHENEYEYRPYLPTCECEHWCHCERYEYFRGGEDSSTRHVNEDKEPIDMIQPWRVPSQQSLSNRILDAEVLPESSMRSTYTHAYGHAGLATPIKREQDVTYLTGIDAKPMSEPRFHHKDGTQRFSWEDEGYGERAPHRWQGDTWRGALSQDGKTEIPRAPEGQWLAMSDGRPMKIVGGKRKYADEWGGKVVELEFDGKVMKRLKASADPRGESEMASVAAEASAGDRLDVAMETPIKTEHNTAEESGLRGQNDEDGENIEVWALSQAKAIGRSDSVLHSQLGMSGQQE